MSGEFQEYHEPTPGNVEYKSPEGVNQEGQEGQVDTDAITGFGDDLNRAIDEEVLSAKQEVNSSLGVAPELTDGFDDTLKQAIDDDAAPEKPEGNSSPDVAPESTDPEAGLDKTIYGADNYRNQLDPTRMKAEDEMVSHLGDVIQVNGQTAETTVESSPIDANSAPVAELPEATIQEQVSGGEAITEIPGVIEESTEAEPSNEVATETSETEATKETVTKQVSPGLNQDQLEYAAALANEMLGDEIRGCELNPVQEENLRVAMALAEKYPNGVKTFVDKNGNHYVAIKPTTSRPDNQITIFCKRGVVKINNDEVHVATDYISDSNDRLGLTSTFMDKGQVDFSEIIDQTIDKIIKPVYLTYTNERGDRIKTKNEAVKFWATNFSDLSSSDKVILKGKMQSAEGYQSSKRIENILKEL